MTDAVELRRSGAPEARVEPAGARPSIARSRRTRVALVVEAAGGGVAVHLADLINGLHEHGGIEIHLIVPTGVRFDATILDASVIARCHSFHRVAMKREVGLHDAVGFARLFRCLARIRPDIVHSHSSKAGVLARLCIGPWKHVYTPHAVYTLNPYLQGAQRRFYGVIERFLGSLRTDRIIAVSDDEATHLRDVLKVPQRRIVTISNGVAAPSLMPRQEARKALALTDDAIVVGFVGRLDFQKGVDRLARVAIAMHECIGEKVQFVVIGPGDFAEASGLPIDRIPPNIRIAGRVSDARQYFSAFDLFAMPSRYEGFAYVCLEAMAARVPMVATRVSGSAELIDDEQTGIVVPNEDDTTEFTRALARLASDETLRARLRKNCERAQEKFSVSAMVGRTVDLYHGLLTERK